MHDMKRWIVLSALALTGAACAVREIPIADLRVQYGLPVSRTFEPSPGVRVHYTDEGPRTGRTIVLVHGFAASVHAWRPWADRLAGAVRCDRLPGTIRHEPASASATVLAQHRAGQLRWPHLDTGRHQNRLASAA